MAKTKRQKKNRKKRKRGNTQSNPVAKYARRFNRHDVHEDKTKYNRNKKHKSDIDYD